MDEEIQFSEEQQLHKFVYKKSWGEKLAGALVKYSGGLIKNENQAYYVILGFVVVAIVVSLFLFFSGGEKSIIPTEGIYTDKNTPPKFYGPK